MATLDDVATFIASAASLTVGTTLFKGQMPPDAADAVTVLYEYPGLRPAHVMGTAAIALEYPKIQVVCRGAQEDYETPRATAETIYRALAAAGNQTLTSTRYLQIEPMQPPFLLGRDANNRVLVAFNVQAEKALSA